MAVIRHLKVLNFRGIQTLDWHVSGRVICLIGPGDSAKTTVLDAIELALLPRWSIPFTDSDFYQANIDEELLIDVTVGELPDVLVKQEKYGMYLRGYSVTERSFHDDPADEDEDVLTIRLLVDNSLEPHWTVVKDSNPEPRPISWRDRELLGVVSLGENVDRNLTWSRGSALARLTDSQSSGHVIAVANRKAREAVGEMQLDEWQQIADQAKRTAKNYGVPVNDLQPGLDVHAIRFGQSVLSLYDGPIPLQSFGLGSKRLASLAVQEAGIGSSSVVLVDEVEHGLEPHRIRKLLDILCEGRDKGQVIMTSHSPTAVVARSIIDLRFTRLTNGRLDVLSCDQESKDALQGAIRSCPIAVFARTVIVCEGKTEEALCRALNRAWAANHGGEDFELRGVVAVNGGGDAAPQTTRQFSRLGYRVAFLGDSDKAINPSEHEIRVSGAEVFRWDGQMATEQRICADVPLETLQALVYLASEIKGEQSCIDSCRRELGKLGASAAAVTSVTIDDWQLNGIEEFTFRMVIGKAAKVAGWFKDLNSGEKLADLIVATLPKIAKTPLGVKLLALEEWLYAG
jgi:hypothetical protein